MSTTFAIEMRKAHTAFGREFQPGEQIGSIDVEREKMPLDFLCALIDDCFAGPPPDADAPENGTVPVVMRRDRAGYGGLKVGDTIATFKFDATQMSFYFLVHAVRDGLAGPPRP